ncbi:LAMI_0D00826g1_1 [Lachancea mirantina]|uniref:Dolichyl-diphosphooligosaccharide--protein glycosyltransferase subunit OST2 n=1 Tax=Lachancea mirantina TaxID=1230905 RepID=A0A1G4J923_9SACH|nr:LAMI_0D00826g1_1 [Lachancea mirantina]
MTSKTLKTRRNWSSKFSETFQASLQTYKKQIDGNSRLKLIDIFCGFLVAVGVIQFAFVCVLKDNFPFNAFLAGFICCVGQFVLTISLRMQVVKSFEGISKERAFGEFIVASLVLHFISLHFVN